SALLQCYCFFFQAEDGIRDRNVTGVQTCALPILERIEIPFEGKKVVGYLQIPKGTNLPPVVIHWGGVDGWKEDRRSNSELLHKEGLATFTIDMPGAGENPCLGQEPRAEIGRAHV